MMEGKTMDKHDCAGFGLVFFIIDLDFLVNFKAEDKTLY